VGLRRPTLPKKPSLRVRWRSLFPAEELGPSTLDPATVAKTSATGLLAVHTLCVLGPEKALQGYGVKGPTPEHVFVASREWAFFLAVSLSAYLGLVHDTSVNTLVGYGTFPIIADVFRSVLNDDEEKLGIPNVAQLGFVVVPLVVNAFVCLKNMESAKTVTTVCGAYNLLKGIWYFLDTANAGKKWGLKEEPDDNMLISGQFMGISLIVYGMQLIMAVQGEDFKKMTGYGWIPVVLNIVRETFITKRVDTCELKKSLYYMWMILGAIVIGTCAID